MSGADCIVSPVTHIINVSITTETVPSAFKDAKVIPLFKKGSTLVYLAHVNDSFDSGIALSVNISDCLRMEDAKEVWADIGK